MSCCYCPAQYSSGCFAFFNIIIGSVREWDSSNSLQMQFCTFCSSVSIHPMFHFLVWHWWTFYACMIRETLLIAVSATYLPSKSHSTCWKCVWKRDKKGTVQCSNLHSRSNMIFSHDNETASWVSREKLISSGKRCIKIKPSEILKRTKYLQHSVKLWSSCKALSFLYGANSLSRHDLTYVMTW